MLGRRYRATVLSLGCWPLLTSNTACPSTYRHAHGGPTSRSPVSGLCTLGKLDDAGAWLLDERVCYATPELAQCLMGGLSFFQAPKSPTACSTRSTCAGLSYRESGSRVPGALSRSVHLLQRCLGDPPHVAGFVVNAVAARERRAPVSSSKVGPRIRARNGRVAGQCSSSAWVSAAPSAVARDNRANPPPTIHGTRMNTIAAGDSSTMPPAYIGCLTSR